LETSPSDDAAALSTKRLGLLKQAVPKIRKVSMLWNKNDLGMTLRYEASADAAKSLGITVQPLGVAGPNDFDDAFAAMDREPPDAILMVSDALTNLNRKRVFEYAAAYRLPAIYENDRHVRDGGLMSVARVGFSVFVKKGAPRPDVGSIDALKRTLMAAKSIVPPGQCYRRGWSFCTNWSLMQN
jgi:ABC-type uncharacterized transport system substrate-binding protein